jgi:hypothetical protein
MIRVPVRSVLMVDLALFALEKGEESLEKMDMKEFAAAKQICSSIQ